MSFEEEEVGMLKLGVIGAGKYGVQLLRGFKQAEYQGLAELVAVADIDEKRLQQAAREFGIRGYHDYREMLNKEELDGVGIATPDHLHRDIAVYVARQGVHLFVEKPLDLTVKGCDEIITAAEKANVLLQVDFHKRFDPPHVVLKNEIQKGTLGDVLYGYMWMEDTIEVPTEWFPNWASSSSPAWFLGIHCYDLFRFLLGCNAVRVYATGHKNKLKAMGIDTYDSIQAKITFENGATIVFDTSWVLPKHFVNIVNQGFRIVGTEGMWEVDGQYRGITTCVTQDGKTSTPNFYLYRETKDPHGKPFFSGYGIDSMLNFVHNVKRLKTGASLADLKGKYADGVDGKEATRIAVAVHESILTGEVIKL